MNRSSGHVVVVGAGLGGLVTALELAPLPVLLLSRAPLGRELATAWAHGGVAAAVGPDDSPALHAIDTHAAGDGICDPEVVDLVTREAPACIERLERFGVRFDRDASGGLSLGREGGHGQRRLVHVRDATGGSIAEALIEAVRRTPSITLLEGVEARELLVEEGRVVGLAALRGNERLVFNSTEVVLATGGAGGLYAHTSNPLGARGSGFVMAARAGALLADLEFVQFHPTAIDVPADPLPLATEALRGEGAHLVNASGERFMLGQHPLAELAPRDVVARAIFRERAAGRGAYLDAREAPGARFAGRFPTVYASCRDAGIDPVTGLIPVAPAAHYHMGGIAVDARARSSIDGLWAVGEVAATGLHGANRLASTSLLECLTGAKATALADVRDIARMEFRLPQPRDWQSPPEDADPTLVHQDLNLVQQTMWNYAGIVRSPRRLTRARRILLELREEIQSFYRDCRVTRELVELRNAVQTALLVVHAASLNPHSKGAHYIIDE